jgi:hypothetical protein
MEVYPFGFSHLKGCKTIGEVVSAVKVLAGPNWMHHVHATFKVVDAADALLVSLSLADRSIRVARLVQADAATLISGTLHDWRLYCIATTDQSDPQVQGLTQAVVDSFYSAGVDLWPTYSRKQTTHGYYLKELR